MPCHATASKQVYQAVRPSKAVQAAALWLTQQRDIVLDKGNVEEREVGVDELEAEGLGDEVVLVLRVSLVVLCV